MKKDKPPYQGSLAVVWGKRVVLPPKEPFCSALRFYLERYPKLGWYVGILSFFGGYAVLFYLPFVYTIDNPGAYLAVVLILWPIVFVFIQAFVEDRPPEKKDWYQIRILKAEKGSLSGLLHHKKQNEPLFLPFQYQYFYKTVEAGRAPVFQYFILCTDQKNQQFILSTTWECLPESGKHATEITNIPEEWYRLLFLVCNAHYLQRYFNALSKLEENSKNQLTMTRKISAQSSLILLVNQDESDHPLKDIALLFGSALRDWPTDNSHDIVKCIQEFKDYFGDPFTFKDGRIINIVAAPYWSWRGEAGAAITEMIELSIQHYDTADFDAIVDRVLSYYEQKFLLTSKQEPIRSTGYARFKLCSSILREADFMHWLGLEPDEFGGTDNTDKFDGTKTTIWSIRTPMTQNSVSANHIQSIVNRLIPIKDRLIAIKQADPDLFCELDVVLWSNPLDLHVHLDNETLLFLGEVGVHFHSQIFTI